MTDQYTEDQVDFYDEENEVVEEGMDPKNAEQQSIASVDKAGETTKQAPKRKGDKNVGDKKAPKTKAGMLNAAFNHLSALRKEDLALAMSKLIDEEDELEGNTVVAAEDTDYDFSEDLNALVESEATLSEEFKTKTAIIFEAAVKSKISEEIDRLETQYKEELDSEISQTRDDMVEKVDSYLNYVVETWMEENKVAIETGLRTEIAEGFMNNLKDLFTESYIEVPESKVDLVDDLAEQVEELETAVNESTSRALAMAEELEGYKRDAIIREASRDLAETQIEKLKSLVSNVDFEDDSTFAHKVATVKESYFNVKSTDTTILEADESDDESVETNDVMDQYLRAIRKSSK